MFVLVCRYDVQTEASAVYWAPTPVLTVGAHAAMARSNNATEVCLSVERLELCFQPVSIGSRPALERNCATQFSFANKLNDHLLLSKTDRRTSVRYEWPKNSPVHSEIWRCLSAFGYWKSDAVATVRSVDVTGYS